MLYVNVHLFPSYRLFQYNMAAEFPGLVWKNLFLLQLERVRVGAISSTSVHDFTMAVNKRLHKAKQEYPVPDSVTGVELVK